MRLELKKIDRKHLTAFINDLKRLKAEIPNDKDGVYKALHDYAKRYLDQLACLDVQNNLIPFGKEPSAEQLGLDIDTIIMSVERDYEDVLWDS